MLLIVIMLLMYILAHDWVGQSGLFMFEGNKDLLIYLLKRTMAANFATVIELVCDTQMSASSHKIHLFSKQT
jgi:hypothetical protein